MKNWIDKLSHYIAKSQNLETEQEKVIAYGMLAFFQMIAILAICAVIGIIIKAVPECICIYLVVGILRKFTGGAHGRSMAQCILISVISISAMAAISKYLLAAFVPFYYGIALTGIIFIAVFIMVYLKAPVDSPNKPINKPEKIKRLRKESFIFLLIAFVISAMLQFIYYKTSNTFFLSVNFSLSLSLLWQGLTLTRLFSFFK